MGVLSIILGYLIGSISTSTVISKWFAHMDIREHGSGNAGATNTLRVLGWKWAVVVLLVDILKGIVAVWIANSWSHGNHWVVYFTAFAAVCGHNWPVFFGFRGGKGVATTIGVLVVLMPIPSLLAGVVAIILVAVTRYVSLGALTFTILTPIFVAVMSHRTSTLLLATAVAVLSVYRHRANIARLVRGEEHRIFSR